MKCETCPIRNYCDAYNEAERDNWNSYHRQDVVRVNEYNESGCPLLKLIKNDKATDDEEGTNEKQQCN